MTYKIGHRIGAQLAVSCAIVLCVALIFVSGCASAQTRRDIEMDTWLGHSYTELLNELGEPTEIKRDIAGDQLLIYEFSSVKFHISQKIIKRDTNLSSGEDEDVQLSKNKKPVMICKFWVNGNGIIQSWRRSGTGEKDIDFLTTGGYGNNNYYMRGNAALGLEGKTKF